jgi:hypothetical protein
MERIGTKDQCSGRKFVSDLEQFLIEAPTSQPVTAGSLIETVSCFVDHIPCRPPTAKETAR